MPILIDDDGGSEEVDESEDEYLDAPEHMEGFPLLLWGFLCY